MRYFIALLLAAASVSNAQIRPPITGIATFAVKVADLDEARKFYTGILGYDEIFVSKATGGTVFKVNDHQYVELSTGLKGDEDRLSFIGLETTDARKLAAYLVSKGVDAPKTLSPDADGNLSFTVNDPNGHPVRFVQYLSGSAHSQMFGQHLSAKRTSEHILHVGIHVPDRAVADRFYVGILKCKLLWEGGPVANPHAWVSVLLPEGTDWIEYMTMPASPNVRQLGGNHHMALGVPDIQTPYQAVTERGYKGQKPILARDGRWLLNLYDPYFTRTEFMVRKPVVTPCCSPLHDPTIQSSARHTDFYFIDVELGNAVLVVTPKGKSILLDSGPEAYADRVLAVLKEAGIKQIDYAVTSHLHWEHYGAWAKIAKEIPILAYVDHGPDVDLDGSIAAAREYPGDLVVPDFEAYARTRSKGKNIAAGEGTKLLLDGVNLNVVSSLGGVIGRPLDGKGMPNPFCPDTPSRHDDISEDGGSVGVILNFGKFRFADFGDLTWNVSRKMFCPVNKIGEVDLYLVSRHAMSDTETARSCCSPAEVYGLKPRVSILSSSYVLPQGTSELQTVQHSPGLEDLWQLNSGKPDPNIVNFDPANCPGKWLKVSAAEDGSFTVTNVGNGFSKHYAVRPR
jgi:competence protein ComEC